MSPHPQSLRVVIPERFLNFDFGKATLTTSADRFLGEVMPAFAAAVCGLTRALIAGIVIVIGLWRKIEAWCLMSEFKREMSRKCQEPKEKDKVEGE